MIVSCFGVHPDRDNIPWLLQAHPPLQNAAGLAQAPDMHVSLGPTKCNHRLILREPTEPYPSDELVRVMLPIPKQEKTVFWVRETEESIDRLSVLSQMSAPIGAVLVPFWAFLTPQAIFKALQLTNIQPLILTGLRLGDLDVVRALLGPAEASPRRLILTGQAAAEELLPARVGVLETAEVSRDKDWARLGGGWLTRWMRGER